jgi:hypothetical protein
MNIIVYHYYFYLIIIIITLYAVKVEDQEVDNQKWDEDKSEWEIMFWERLLLIIGFG